MTDSSSRDKLRLVRSEQCSYRLGSYSGFSAPVHASPSTPQESAAAAASARVIPRTTESCRPSPAGRRQHRESSSRA